MVDAMKYLRYLAGATAIVILALCQSGTAQEQSKEPGGDAKNIGPRAAPADYQAHAQAGNIAIGAEYTAHSITTPEGVYTTEDYVAVEVGLFGPPDARAKISIEDFALRVNGKKMPAMAQPYGATFESLKDPEWEPPATEKKSKGGISTGGGGGESDSLPAIVHMPIELKRAMQLRVQKSALREGDRALPEAGLLFFPHRGKTNSVELIYNGPAGKAALALHP
jgi:hypothetical protein